MENNTTLLPIGTKVRMKEMGKNKTYTITGYEDDMLGTYYIIPPFSGSFTKQSFMVISIPADIAEKIEKENYKGDVGDIVY